MVPTQSLPSYDDQLQCKLCETLVSDTIVKEDVCLEVSVRLLLGAVDPSQTSQQLLHLMGSLMREKVCI